MGYCPPRCSHPRTRWQHRSLWLQKTLLSATLIETPFSLSTHNYKGSLDTSEPQQKRSTHCKKGIHHPCNLTFHLLQPRKLPHRCSPLTQKAKTKGKKSFPPAHSWSAPGCCLPAWCCQRYHRQEQGALVEQGRRGHSLNHSLGQTTTETCERNTVVHTPELNQKALLQSNISAFAVSRPRAAYLHHSADATRWSHWAVLCVPSSNNSSIRTSKFGSKLE